VPPGSIVRGSWRFDAIGTSWEILTPSPLRRDAAEAVEARIAAYDRTWSRFRGDSLVARVGREPGAWRLPGEAGPLLDLYRELHEATDGRMSPLVGASLERLGYGASISPVASGPGMPAPAWADALAWDGAVLSTPRPVVLDVGAAGKGQLVDLVADVLEEHGVDAYTIDASGDIRYRGEPEGRPLRVALEDPRDPRLAIGVAELADGALCASATNRRAWGDGIHHVLDALTGLPVADVVATWVTAPSTMVADGVATALFLTSPGRIPSSLGAEWARMDSSGRVEASARFPGELFT